MILHFKGFLYKFLIIIYQDIVFTVWEYLSKNEFIPIWNEFILIWNEFIPDWNEFILGLNNFFENREPNLVEENQNFYLLFAPKRIFHKMLFRAGLELFLQKTCYDLE